MSKKILFPFFTLLAIVLIASACNRQKKWSYKETITLPERLHPLGIVFSNDSLWISAPDQKMVATIDGEGNTTGTYAGLERPMHLSAFGGKVYVPIYLNDEILIIQNGTIDTLRPRITPDAPGGISVRQDTMAIADFFNHRIILQIGDTVTTIGEKGHEKGQLFYPTDVEISSGTIYVADAYNNRVQTFDASGNALQVTGEKDGINVANGVAVYDNQVFIPDFYNNRILVYDREGELVQTLSDHFEKPTGITTRNGELYVANFGTHSLVIYSRR